MKILLTGAAGFIGFHTAKALCARGDEVIGLDNFSPYYDPALKEARASELAKMPNFTMIRGDILDRETVRTHMKGVDRVCHLAALAGVRYGFEHPEEYVDTNIKGTFNIFDEARLQEIPGVVYASSSSVYGNNKELPSREEHRTDAQESIYGMTKKDNELMAYTYHSTYGLHLTGLRFFTVYGTWGRPDMALFIFADALAKDKPLPIFGHGKMQRDFTYVEDIAAGIIASIDKNYPYEIFNLGCGRQEELMEYVRMVEVSFGREAKKDFMPMQPGDVIATSADISKAKKMLDFEPKTMIQEGVPKFIEWYREYYKI